MRSRFCRFCSNISTRTPESPFLGSLQDSIPEFMEETSVKSLNLNLLDGFRSSYVRYQGSATTPP